MDGKLWDKTRDNSIKMYFKTNHIGYIKEKYRKITTNFLPKNQKFDSHYLLVTFCQPSPTTNFNRDSTMSNTLDCKLFSVGCH